MNRFDLRAKLLIAAAVGVVILDETLQPLMADTPNFHAFNGTVKPYTSSSQKY